MCLDIQSKIVEDFKNDPFLNHWSEVLFRLHCNSLPKVVLVTESSTEVLEYHNPHLREFMNNIKKEMQEYIAWKYPSLPGYREPEINNIH